MASLFKLKAKSRESAAACGNFDLRLAGEFFSISESARRILKSRLGSGVIFERPTEIGQRAIIRVNFERIIYHEADPETEFADFHCSALLDVHTIEDIFNDALFGFV